MYSFTYLEPFCCSMSSSNCCFLTSTLGPPGAPILPWTLCWSRCTQSSCLGPDDLLTRGPGPGHRGLGSSVVPSPKHPTPPERLGPSGLLGPHPAHLGILGQGLGRKATWSQVMPRLWTNLMNFPLKFVQLFLPPCEQER